MHALTRTWQRGLFEPGLWPGQGQSTLMRATNPNTENIKIYIIIMLCQDGY